MHIIRLGGNELIFLFPQISNLSTWKQGTVDGGEPGHLSFFLKYHNQ